MAMFTRVAGVWKEITGPAVKVAGVWKPITGGWVNVGGVWKSLFSSVDARDLAASASNTSGGTASASIEWGSANTNGLGWVAEIENGVLGQHYQWLLSGSASDYEIFFTLSAGAVTAGSAAMGVWHNLGAAVTVAQAASGSEGNNSGNGDYTIRKVGGNNVGSGTWSVSATSVLV